MSKVQEVRFSEGLLKAWFRFVGSWVLVTRGGLVWQKPYVTENVTVT